MKSTGIVRKVDQLGRIVTPIELRRSMGVNIGDPMEIFLDDDRIILRKFESAQTCVVTGEVFTENFESQLIKGMHLSPRGARLLLEELQNVSKK